MPALVTNNATTTLASGITAAATSLSVAATTGALFPSPSSPDYFYCTLAGTAGIEIVKVTARATDTFTITRAQDGTTAKAYSAGETVELRPVAALFDVDALLPDQTSAANKVLVSNGTSASWSSNLSGLTLAAPVLTDTATAVDMTFSGTVLLRGGTFPGVATTQQWFNSVVHSFVLSTGSANERVWDIACFSGVFHIRAVDDAYATPVNAITISRSGTTISSINTGAAIRGVDGSVSFPSYSFINDTDTGIYRTAADELAVATGGTKRFAVNSGGFYLYQGAGWANFSYTGADKILSVTCSDGTSSAGGYIQVLGDYAARLGDGYLAVLDGRAAPSTISGYAVIYVDSADGDLKVKFGDGTTKTIVVDT